MHTRPIGTFKDPDPRRRVMQELDDVLAKFECGQRLVTLAGVRPDLGDASLTPEELLVELVRGTSNL